MTPSERDLAGPRRTDIERYFQGAQAPAPERIQLFRLAWDIVGSVFGSRQVLYERYFSGDPVRLTAGRYLTYAKAPLLERVCAFLQQADELGRDVAVSARQYLTRRPLPAPPSYASRR